MSLDAGQTKEVENELRGILVEWTRIAGAEPENLEYQESLLAAEAELGRLLVHDGRTEEGQKAFEPVLAALSKLDADRPRVARVRQRLFADLLAAGELAVSSNHVGAGAHLFELARDLSQSNAQAGIRSSIARLQAADLEYRRGRLYAGFGLLPEAAETMNVDLWPADVELWRQIRAGELHHLCTRPASLRKVGDRALDQCTKHSDPWTLAAGAVANIVRPDGPNDARRLLEIAKLSARGADAEYDRWLLVAACAYRAGLPDEAIRYAGTPGLCDRPLAMPILAMRTSDWEGRSKRASGWREPWPMWLFISARGQSPRISSSTRAGRPFWTFFASPAKPMN